jgi:hypothetical protein
VSVVRAGERVSFYRYPSTWEPELRGQGVFEGAQDLFAPGETCWPVRLEDGTLVVLLPERGDYMAAPVVT